ncbi:MAG: hypothetical protein HKN12_01045 [Gemmatimonadetes bacterium]|nr:hypothetical protein [Gemmatimonadota bacterium]
MVALAAALVLGTVGTAAGQADDATRAEGTARVLGGTEMPAEPEKLAELPVIIPPANFGEVGPRPLNRALRSVAFPAWGQLTNGKNRKAAVILGIQTYVWTRVIMEGRKGNESERRIARLTAEGAPAAEIDQAEFSAEEHFDTRRDLLFWAIMTTFYGALDAYIDAHLGDFDRELEEGRELFGAVNPTGVEVGLRF